VEICLIFTDYHCLPAKTNWIVMTFTTSVVAPLLKQHYFLDEAGDPCFYGKGKTIIVGQQGVSLYYLLGMVQFEGDLQPIRNQVIQLQQEITSNPYFAGVGSIEKKKQQRGFYFHATDDVPEVRKLFFDFIKSLNCSFEVVVAAKIPGLYVKKHNANQKEFYADLLSHLLHEKLTIDKRLVLNIADRNTSTRQDNLELGLKKAIARFTKQNPTSIINPNVVFNVQNQLTEPLLNIADYLCWSVQRVFEKGETRFYNYIKDKIKVVADIYEDEVLEGEEQMYYRKTSTVIITNKKGPSAT
jgi:hypothetical protein